MSDRLSKGKHIRAHPEIQVELDHGPLAVQLLHLGLVQVRLSVAPVEEAGEAADPGADDPEEVVHGAEEVAADQEEARHVHVQEKPGEGIDFCPNVFGCGIAS